ncbi:hypothetical protein BDQ17DRAFT_1363054 [Cyathus striatus]|nr:hypothetical protein BDQ17DRAFT_1363054 [Cyathus striatus]
MAELVSGAAPGQQEPNRKLVVVTANSERYVTIDVENLHTVASLKDKFLEKVQQDIPEADIEQSDLFIFRTEIGDIGFGGHPLTDDQLVQLCLEDADSRGSVKLFLSRHATMEGWIKGFRT